MNLEKFREKKLLPTGLCDEYYRKNQKKQLPYRERKCVQNGPDAFYYWSCQYKIYTHGNIFQPQISYYLLVGNKSQDVSTFKNHITCTGFDTLDRCENFHYTKNKHQKCWFSCDPSFKPRLPIAPYCLTIQNDTITGKSEKNAREMILFFCRWVVESHKRVDKINLDFEGRNCFEDPQPKPVSLLPQNMVNVRRQKTKKGKRKAKAKKTKMRSSTATNLSENNAEEN